MPINRHLKQRFTDRVTINRTSSYDGWNPPVQTAVPKVKAFVEEGVRHVWTVDGEEKVSVARVFLDSTELIDTDDTITLPNGNTYPIVLISRPRTISGPGHIEVTL